MKNAYTSAATALNPTIPSSVSQPIIGKESQMTPNDGGGYSYILDKWAMLDRFIIIGTEGGTYYVSEKNITMKNATNVIACIKENPMRVIDAIVEVSDKGRAMKNEPALFALALVVTHGDDESRKHAFSVLPKVARIGTHLFAFVEYVNSMRGWGRALRNAVSSWYLDKEISKLVLQLTKYQSRNGWSHRDVLRLAHTKPNNETQNQAFKWSTGKLDDIREIENVDGLELIHAFETIKKSDNEGEIISLITKHNLPMELIPTEKRSVPVLEALLPNLGITALIRNLGMYTSKGLFENYSDLSRMAIKNINNIDILKKGRIHPMFVLNALVTYSNGHGEKGKLSWNVNQNIVNALDEAFYMSFEAVEPTNKNLFYGLDVSRSMNWGNVIGMSLMPSQVVAAMAMVGLKTESE